MSKTDKSDEEELTFGKREEDQTDSMNYTKEESQDLMPDSIQQDMELESKDRQLFGDSHKYENEPLIMDDNEDLDHSTGTFGQHAGLDQHLKGAKPQRKVQSAINRGQDPHPKKYPGISEISSRDCDLTESKHDSMNERETDEDPLENIEINTNIAPDFDNLEIPDKVPDNYERPKQQESDSDDECFGNDRSGSISDQEDRNPDPYGQVYTEEDLEQYKKQIEKAIDLQF